MRQLAARGVRTIAHVRPDSPALPAWRERFAGMGAEIDTTPWKPDAIEATLRAAAPDAVFALLGTTQTRARAAARSGLPDASHETVDYGLTHMLLEAVRRVAPAARFIYLSSVGASTDSRTEYLRIRGRIEDELRDSGLAWLAAQPVLVSGPDRDERRITERVGAVLGDALLNALALVGATRIRDRYRSISSDRLARALVDLSLVDTDPDEGWNRVVRADELQRRAG